MSQLIATTRSQFTAIPYRRARPDPQKAGARLTFHYVSRTPPIRRSRCCRIPRELCKPEAIYQLRRGAGVLDARKLCSQIR
jgi:hypothetical protein